MAQKQINVSMPKEWLEQLEQLASSYTPKKVRSPFEMIREVVRIRPLTPRISAETELTPVKKAC